MNSQDMYMNLAFIEAEKSVAKRLKVGAILVNKGNVISKGYNHMPDFMEPDCEFETINENGDLVLVTKPELIHAESWCLSGVSKNYIDDDTVIYITDSPCIDCAKLIYQIGIRHVVYARDYRITKGIDFLRNAGVEVIKYN